MPPPNPVPWEDFELLCGGHPPCEEFAARLGMNEKYLRRYFYYQNEKVKDELICNGRRYLDLIDPTWLGKENRRPSLSQPNVIIE